MESTQCIFTNFNYVDPVAGKIQEGVSMLVNDGRVEKIQKKPIKVNSIPEIDLMGQYITPGLINNHVHLSGSGTPLPKFLDRPKLLAWLRKRSWFHKFIQSSMKNNAYEGLKQGITAVRSLGEAFFNVKEVRDDINSGKLRGSRIFTSIKIIAIIEEHIDIFDIQINDDIDEAIAATNELLDNGADCIKILSTGGVTGAKELGHAGKPLFSVEVMKAIIDTAHKAGIRVTAHAEGLEGARRCVEAGIDSIEHGSAYTEEMLQRMKKNNIGIIPTLASGLAYSLADAKLTHIEYLNSIRIDREVEIGLRRAIKNGILIGCGDDAGIPLVLHGKLAQEIIMLNEEYGLSPMDAIKCATINNAIILGKEKFIGSLEPGKFADFNVFRNNPLEDLYLLFNPDIVFKDGMDACARKETRLLRYWHRSLKWIDRQLSRAEEIELYLKTTHPRSMEVVDLYELMIRSRYFEELTKILWEDGLVPGELHLGIGEEATIAAVIANLKDGDAIASDHRGSPPFIMRGVDPISILLEIMGYPGEESLCAGLGGHMHLFSKENLMASSGIVGASGPGATGFALAAKYKKTDNISVSFSGEGSYNQGHLLEAMNLASALKLPVLFVCKDNGWSITTKSETITGGDLVQRARGFGIEGISLNGLDVEEVHNALKSIIPQMRKDKKPFFLHVIVTHREGHFTTDPLLHPKETLKKFGGPMTKSFLTPKGARVGKRIKGVGNILASLVEFRKQSSTKNDPLRVVRKKHKELGQEFDSIEKRINEEINLILEKTLLIYGGGDS